MPPLPLVSTTNASTVADATSRRQPVTVGTGTSCVTFGGPGVVLIAGPCSVESRDMLVDTARDVAGAGAAMLRGGAFKPRTSPYAFSGLGEAALAMLDEARAITGMPVVTEVMDTRLVELVAAHADMLQVGARNMQNFALLAEVGRSGMPVLLKRGLSASISDLLHAAEHVLATGNARVVLCERGIRTFETATRNTLDVSAVPVLQRETHLPVIVDPSHAGGHAPLVGPLAAAAVAVGADGLMIEVHPDPAAALSDGEQSITPSAFAKLVGRLEAIAIATERSLHRPPAGRPANQRTAASVAATTPQVPAPWRRACSGTTA